MFSISELPTEWINAKTQYGADSTGATDATAAIQNAINALPGGKGVVVLPPGNYHIDTGPLTMGTNVQLVGYGPTCTTLTCAGSGIAPATPGTRSYYQSIRDLSLLGPGIAAAGTIGIDLDSISQGRIHNVNISQFETGISHHSVVNGGACWNDIDECTILLCTTGLSMAALGSNSLRCRHTRFGANTTGVLINGSNQNVFTDCQIEANTSYGFRFQSATLGLSDGNVVQACRFESNGTAWQIDDANVRYTYIAFPYISGTYTTVNNGTGTMHIVTNAGALASLWPHMVGLTPKTVGASGRWTQLSLRPLGLKTSTGAIAKDSWRFVPISIDVPLVINGIALETTVAASGGTALARFSLFSSDAYNMPSVLAQDWTAWTSIDVTATAGVLTSTGLTNKTIPVGHWWLGCAWTGTATVNPTFRVTDGGHPQITDSSAVVVGRTAYYYGSSGATAPDGFTCSGIGTFAPSILGLMV